MSYRTEIFEHVEEVTLDAPVRETHAIRVNESGNLDVTFASGARKTLYVLAGVEYDWAVTEAHSSGTTATGIHALYF